MLLAKQQVREATSEGGLIGPPIHTPKFSNANLHHYIGGEVGPKSGRRFGQAILGVSEYANHIGFFIQQSTFKYTNLFVPKADVLEWGVMRVGDIPGISRDHTGLLVGALLFGPFGALVGDREDKKETSKPAISIVYQCDGEENALFLTFNLNAFYRNFYDFLGTTLPTKAKE